MVHPRLSNYMRHPSILLAALLLLGSQSAFAATKETYAHKMEMGNLLFFNGDMERAIKAFQRAGELNPKAFDPHFSLINLWVQKGGDNAIQEAEAECVKALEVKPQSKEVHMIYGKLLSSDAATEKDKDKQAAKFDQAVKEINASMELGMPEAACESQIAMLLLQKGDFDKSLEHINKSIAKQPISADAHLVKAVLLFKPVGAEHIGDPENKDKLQAVLDELDLSIKQKDKNAEAHNTKADVLTSAKRYTEAAKEYEAATKDEPKYGAAWVGLGSVHMQMLDTDKENKGEHKKVMRDALDHARKLRPDDKNILYALPLMLEKLGDVQDAIDEFNKSLALETDFQWQTNIKNHIMQLQNPAGFGGGLSVGVPGAAPAGGSIFLNGALSQPFSTLIKLDDGKEQKK
jgi:tetratricopeptide (TPR) repeat protein